MTDAELAILSIIAEQPIAGCDVQNVIEERNVRMWTMIGVESMYYVIQKLEQQGLIINIDEHPPHDLKLRMYRVTSAGMGVLQTAVSDLLSSLHFLPRGIEIGLANLPVLNPYHAQRSLLTYRSGLATRYEALTEQLQNLMKDETPFHILSMFKHQIALVESEMSWFDEWMPQWKAQIDWEDVDDRIPEIPYVEIPRHHQVILPEDPDSFHKRPTRRLDPDPEGIELPPPPQRREKKPDKTSKSDTTKASSSTKPKLE